MDRMLFASGDRQIVGDLFVPQRRGGGRPGLLFVHGRGSSRRGYVRRAAAACAGLDAVSLTIDLSGHGESVGDPERFTPANHADDVIVALQALSSNERVDPSRIGIVGASYGAYLAGLAAGRLPVRQLLLRAPALYADSDLQRPLADLHASADADAAEFFGGIVRSGAAVLILESEHDDEIHPDVIHRYLTKIPLATHQILPGASHALLEPEWDGWFIGTTMSWGQALL